MRKNNYLYRGLLLAVFSFVTGITAVGVGGERMFPELFPLSESGQTNKAWLSFVYEDRPVNYSPFLDETFSVNVVVDPRGNTVQALQMDIIFSDIDLYFVGGGVSGGTEGLEMSPKLFNVEQLSSQTRKIPVAVFSGFYARGITEKKPVLHLTFTRRSGNKTQINFEKIVIAADEIDGNALGQASNLMISEASQKPPHCPVDMNGRVICPAYSPPAPGFCADGIIDDVKKTNDCGCLLPPACKARNNPINWQTKTVSLTAEDFYIIANGQKYFANLASVDVRSDPGNKEYTTLETTWNENNREMRLYMYFRADAGNWWPYEIRTYNGQERGDWIYYTNNLSNGYENNKFFTFPLGTPYKGNLALKSDNNNQFSGQIYFNNLKLLAFVKDGQIKPPPFEIPCGEYKTDLVISKADQGKTLKVKGGEFLRLNSDIGSEIVQTPENVLKQVCAEKNGASKIYQAPNKDMRVKLTVSACNDLRVRENTIRILGESDAGSGRWTDIVRSLTGDVNKIKETIVNIFKTTKRSGEDDRFSDCREKGSWTAELTVESRARENEMCGGFAGIQCAEGLYCDYGQTAVFDDKDSGALTDNDGFSRPVRPNYPDQSGVCRKINAGGVLPATKSICEIKGGKWSSSKNCLVRCDRLEMCMYSNCDCGADRCWDGDACISNPVIAPPTPPKAPVPSYKPISSYRPQVSPRPSLKPLFSPMPPQSGNREESQRNSNYPVIFKQVIGLLEKIFGLISFR